MRNLEKWIQPVLNVTRILAESGIGLKKLKLKRFVITTDKTLQIEPKNLVSFFEKIGDREDFDMELYIEDMKS
jgi:hypothetical protein